MLLSMKVSPILCLMALAIGMQQSPQSLVTALDEIDYLDAPVVAWQAQTGVILDGNGVYTSPDDSITVVTQSSGKVSAFDTFTGASLWTFTPPSNNDRSIACQSGVTFLSDGQDDFLVYSIIDDPNGVVTFTRVISLNLDGLVKWISTPLEGAAAGNPVASYDGRYVFLTHNSNDMSVGHFSVLDTMAASSADPVFPLYSEFNVTNPFSPPGIFHSPEEGFYDGGQSNTNDIVVWAHAPNPSDATVGAGATFVFQFPVGYIAPNRQSVARQRDVNSTATDVSDMSRRLFWMLLGNDVKDWQSVAAPVLANQGRSIYWSVSRSSFRAWVGATGLNSARFNRGRTASPVFARGSPRNAAAPNTPALSSSDTEPMIFAGTASEQFVKMDYKMDQNTALVRNITSRVRAKAIVSPDDKFVYFTEFSGMVHQAFTDDLSDNWNTKVGTLDGEFALTSDGTMLIVGDATGRLNAYQVANRTSTPESTPSPSATPSPAPTAEQQPTAGFRPTVDAPISMLESPTDKPVRSPIFLSTPTSESNVPALPTKSDAMQTRIGYAWIGLFGVFALMV